MLLSVLLTAHFCLTLILRPVREKLNSFRRKIIQEKKTTVKIYLLKCPWLSYLFQDEFGEDCFSSYEGLKEDTQIIVRYDGKYVTISCDYFSFEPAESKESGVSRKLCVKPLNFTDPDCYVQVEIKSSYFDSSLHVSKTVYLNIISHGRLIRCRFLHQLCILEFTYLSIHGISKWKLKKNLLTCK